MSTPTSPSGSHDPNAPHAPSTGAATDGHADASRRPVAGYGGGFRMGRLFGVEIRVDWSLAIIFALILFNLGAGLFPLWHPDWSPLLAWGVAFGAAVAFFVSVLLHELSHAVVARANGISVRGITLFLFGGLAHMEGEPPTPRSEFLMAIVGPVTSAAIGIAAATGGWALAGPALAPAVEANDPEALQAALARVGPVATLLLWLGPVNVILALFNVLPGFPLDGGRVLRSVLWGITDDLVKATRWASRAGQAFAWLLMAWGVLDILAGAFAQGIWLILIGWFLNTAARRSYQELLIRQALEDVPVARVMRSHLDRVSPEMSIQSFVRDHVMVTEQQAFPVERDESLVGLVSLYDLRKVPQTEWGVTPVQAIMTPVESLSTLPPDVGAERALEELSRHDVEQIPIVEGRRLLGLVRRGDLVKWLAIRTGQPGTSHHPYSR